MSPRAAWRLEGLGFERVYDYVPGKADWSASGLPTEGTLASVPDIGDAARRDAPTCTPTEKVGAHDGAHDGAQDQARAERGEPAEDHADPARSQLRSLGHPASFPDKD
jgi:3-mercaptopyruvate sulfurtransferase SseA